jgi:hypothetical protein
MGLVAPLGHVSTLLHEWKLADLFMSHESSESLSLGAVRGSV